MATRRVLSVTGDVALELLRLTAASADAFPPLKGAAGGVLHIAEVVKKFRSNKEEWQAFQEYIQIATGSVIAYLAHTDLSQSALSHADLKDKLDKLKSTIDDILASIDAKRGRSRLDRIFKFVRDPDMIKDMRKKLDDAVGLFALILTITTDVNVQKTMEAVVTNSNILSGIAQDTAAIVTNTDAILANTTAIATSAAVIETKTDGIEKDTAAVAVNTKQIASNAALDKLRRVQGASWDPLRVCLPDTRVKVLEDIYSWLDNADGAQIYLFTGVAGAGKTTIAHTVAKHFAESGRLASSFFFDRETDARSSPIALFTTIAADMANVSPELGGRITAAIEGDPGLPLAPLSRQFQELVLKPCQEHPTSKPYVVVIDALEEGLNERSSSDLLNILCDNVPHLPSTFRIFLTSRTLPALGRLCRQPHVQETILNVDSSENMLDVGIFVRSRLRQLAESRDFGPDWPGNQLRADFKARAGGLFIWVTIMCEFLDGRSDPMQELEQLLSNDGLAASSAELRMDALYAHILGTCNWDDKSFEAGYHRIMGTAIASKIPLTISAQNMLFGAQSAVQDFVLQKLSPLLTGTSKDCYDSQPVRVLHQSLRDFLVLRAGSSLAYTKYQIDEQKHSQEMGLLCLRLLDHKPVGNGTGVGYLAKADPQHSGIPKIEVNAISEALVYACHYWSDHLENVPLPSTSQPEELVVLIASTMVTCMEIMTAEGKFSGLLESHEMVEASPASPLTEQLQELMVEHAKALLAISLRLSFDDRRSEAHLAAQESLVLYQKLATKQPDVFNMELIKGLNTLSARLIDLSRHNEALVVAQEAEQLCRQQTGTPQTLLTAELAGSLNRVSICLALQESNDDALSAIQEAVQLYRQLEEDQPAMFTAGLAESLRDLSSIFSYAGNYEDMLKAIQEALQLYRQLAKENPTSFIPELAMTLVRLFDANRRLGRGEDDDIMLEAATLIEQVQGDPNVSTKALRKCENLYSDIGFCAALTPCVIA